MEWNSVVRLLAFGLLIGIAACVGHDDPVGVVQQPEEVEDADARESAPPVLPPSVRFFHSGM